MIKVPRRQLVQAAAAKLRDVILAREAGAQIGSLNEVAHMLGVGIVTVQQAARVLEHEGLLAVRRGPGGGYYGTRPDEAALERAFAAYLRVHGFGQRESQRMMSLLDLEIIPAAARCNDEGLRRSLRSLLERVDHCESIDARIAFEIELRDLLLRMVTAPLMEDIDSAECIRCGLRHVLHRRGIRDIDAHRDRPAAGGYDFVADALRAVGFDIRDHHRSPRAAQTERVGSSDAVAATAGAGHDGHFSVEAELID